MAKKNKKRYADQSIQLPASERSSDNVIQKNKSYQSLLTGLILLTVFIFSLFLRLEDFAAWQESPWLFKYQNEYQMANFDSYYYLQFAKDLERNHYDDVDEKRLVPNGAQRPKVPPLLSVLTLGISKISNIPLPTVAIFMPTFLSSLLIFIVFFLGRRLSLNRVAALTAALLSIISITYVTRTRLGVFDTDSLNVIFALLNSYFLLRFALSKQTVYGFLVLTLLNTFLYFIWWDNAISVVMLSAFVPLSVVLLFFYQGKNTVIKYYFLAALGLIGLYFLSEQIYSYAQLVFAQNNEVFPIYDEIVELQVVNLITFIRGTTGSIIIFITALIGAVYFVKIQKTKTLFIAFPVALGLLPLLAGNRFMIFSAPILALGVGYFVQLLFDFKDKINIVSVYLGTVFIVGFAIYSNYGAITYKVARPAVLENRVLLDVLKTHTPVDANIWTNWDLGNQIHYYLDRGTFADGQFSDGEIFYYLRFPLAADNLALSANFISFYAQHGKQGMHKLYQILTSEVATFDFLKEVLSLKPNQAKKIIERKLQHSQSFKTSELATVEQWLAFLYPQQDKVIYLFLHQKMLQTAGWFKQGNIDLKTGQTKGLALFLSFNNLTEKWGEISNKDIKINKKNGRSMHVSGVQHSFSHILTHDGEQAKIKRYSNYSNNSHSAAERFVFEWHKVLGYGAVMSYEVSNTSFNRLFMRHEQSDYFQPISLKTPEYQIWKVLGDVSNSI